MRGVAEAIEGVGRNVKGVERGDGNSDKKTLWFSTSIGGMIVTRTLAFRATESLSPLERRGLEGRAHKTAV